MIYIGQSVYIIDCGFIHLQFKRCKMTFKAEINIMPHKELLDPQGKTVAKNMKNIDLDNVIDVRIGKHIVMELEAESQEKAEAKVELACKKLLANVIMEKYDYTVTSL